MKLKTINPPSQWSNIVNRLQSGPLFQLDRFKRTPEFMIFGTFDPKRFGLLYYKLLVHHLFSHMPLEAKKIFLSIQNKTVGSPYSIRIKGEEICLDYMQAAYEAHFMKDELHGVHNVVEIGAGFGRTCHAILSNFKNIEKYLIIDLDFMLEVSGKYLSAVLNKKDFSKLSFISVSTNNKRVWKQIPGNCLFINIDSLAEMEERQVNTYLDLIDEHGCFFYSNNTLGKYNPKDVGEEIVKRKDFKDAISSGKLPDIIDIFDDRQTSSRIAVFRRKYRPSPKWDVIKEGFASCYPHYYQVTYKRNNSG